MKSLLLALQFLSIIPLRVPGTVTPEMIGRSVGAYPAAGLLIGLIAATAGHLFQAVLPPDIASLLILLVLTLVNGGFHLDGLADTLDALAVKSSGNMEADRRKRLDVMKDGASGPAGTIAIVFSLLLKFLALRFVIETLGAASPGLVFGLIVLVPVYGKWSLVPAAAFGAAARADGLACLVLSATGPREMVYALFVTVAAVIGVLVVLSGEFATVGLAALLLLLVPAFHFLSVLFRMVSARKFGGLTGDVFGALNEVTEVLFLLGASLWLRLTA